MLATAFVGLCFSRYEEGRLSGKRLAVIATSGAILGVALACVVFNAQETGLGKGCMAASWVAGYLLFAVLFLLRRVPLHGVFLWLGVVSYSLYLVHTLVLGPAAVLLRGPSVAFATILGSIALAALSYRWIEQPANRIGRFLTLPQEAVAERDTRKAAAATEMKNG
jgi:peptidoglycan/LPS O-acetylase OafA/YrhL